MCSAYWNLTVTFTCPACGRVVEDVAQTHWRGRDGSCGNYYRLGEPVAELAGITAFVLNGHTEYFDAECPACGVPVDLGAEIRDGAVVRVWQVPEKGQQP